MEFYFFHHDEFQQRYNCTVMGIKSPPLEERRNLLAGIAYLFTSLFSIFIYIPCFYALTRKELRERSCYKIMILLAIYDLVTLSTTGAYSGVMALNGITVCEAPLLHYVFGSIILGFWIGYTWGTLILALNRIFAASDFGRFFEGTYLYYWLCIPPTLTLLSMTFQHPAIFVSKFAGCVFNPFVFTLPETHFYDNPSHSINNTIFMIVLPAIYFTFYIKNRYFINANAAIRSSGDNKRDRSLFIQTVIISSLVCLATLGYTLMQVFTLPVWTFAASHYLWIWVQGSPPLIFLTMNKTVRKIVFRSVIGKDFASAIGPYSNSNITA